MPGAVVVGTGFGCRVHVPALRAAGFDVVALVGRDGARTARRAERSGVPHACDSLADALALPGVDAVTIATPPATHAALAIEAAHAGSTCCARSRSRSMPRRRSPCTLRPSRRGSGTWSGTSSGGRRSGPSSRAPSPTGVSESRGWCRWSRSLRWCPTSRPGCPTGGSMPTTAAAGWARRVRTSSTRCAPGSASSSR